MALQLRPNCEYCDKDLPPESLEARICSYECTFCAECVESKIFNVCPNCGGGFVPRPIRPAKEWRMIDHVAGCWGGMRICTPFPVIYLRIRLSLTLLRESATPTGCRSIYPASGCPASAWLRMILAICFS